MEFMSSWAGMGLMAVLLIGLVGVLLYVRKKQSDD